MTRRRARPRYAPATRRAAAVRRARRSKLRWYHLLAASLGAFALGYLVGAAHITSMFGGTKLASHGAVAEELR